ncbi:putative transcription factor bHLH family [Helianthus annuus]|nr:putative transcription factor bHLH family [Helianthus annuus]
MNLSLAAIHEAGPRIKHVVVGHSNSCSKAENKACRERQRREILNNRFLELSSTLEPDRPATTDKLAILGDAIRVLNQLKSDAHDFKEMNEKLSEDIKTSKIRKEQACEEKLVLKAEKEKMEQRVESVTNNLPPPVLMTPHPTAFQAAAIKMPFFPRIRLHTNVSISTTIYV